VTKLEALAHALALAIIASTEENAARAAAVADQLAAGLTTKQVAQAKRRALAIVKGAAP
jgi:hypothetical protein